jgi:hypothetical protein
VSRLQSLGHKTKAFVYVRIFSPNTRESMEHFFLEAFRIAAQYILGPLVLAWLTAKLNKKPKA